MKYNTGTNLTRLALLSVCVLSVSVIAGCSEKGKQETGTPASAVQAPEPPAAAKTATPEAPEQAPKQAPLLDEASTIEVTGRSIGPIALGMPQARVASLGLAVHPQYSAMTVPYSVYYKDDKVSGVSVSLRNTKRPVVVAGKTIPAAATLDEAAELIGECGEAQLLIGGTTRKCAQGITVSIGSGSPDEVWLRIDAEAE
jgi:hypothetical protein